MWVIRGPQMTNGTRSLSLANICKSDFCAAMCPTATNGTGDRGDDTPIFEGTASRAQADVNDTRCRPAGLRRDVGFALHSHAQLEQVDIERAHMKVCAQVKDLRGDL